MIGGKSVNIGAYHRARKAEAKAQSAWDHMCPPDDEDDGEYIDDEPDFEAILEAREREI